LQPLEGLTEWFFRVGFRASPFKDIVKEGTELGEKFTPSLGIHATAKEIAKQAGVAVPSTFGKKTQGM